MNSVGTQDWRDAKAYPKSADELSDALWRWERLRRRETYRIGWYLSEIDPTGFGVSEWLDPRIARPSYLPLVAHSAEPYLWVFDLARPLKSQLREAEKVMVQQQHFCERGEAPTGFFQGGPFRHVRQRRQMWPLYLRVLDGRADDATYAEIGEVIFGKSYPEAGIYGIQAYKAAVAWRDAE